MIYSAHTVSASLSCCAIRNSAKLAAGLNETSLAVVPQSTTTPTSEVSSNASVPALARYSGNTESSPEPERRRNRSPTRSNQDLPLFQNVPPPFPERRALIEVSEHNLPLPTRPTRHTTLRLRTTISGDPIEWTTDRTASA